MPQPVRIEPTNKRIRTFYQGLTVADSTRVSLVWDIPYYPTYYFPVEDVDMGLLKANGETTDSKSRGPGQLYDLMANGHTATGVGRVHAESPVEELRGLIALDWEAMDAWFEEDEQVYVHARDPFVRIDALASSRQVRVEVDGLEVAKSTNARFLFETGLPARYYIPKTDIRMDLLEATDLQTGCPYKGVASYYSVNGPSGIRENIAWWYPMPAKESAEVAGMVSFYNEKVDIWLDGEQIPRPESPFS